METLKQYYTFFHSQTDSTEAQTDKQTERQTHKKTQQTSDRQTDRTDRQSVEYLSSRSSRPLSECQMSRQSVCAVCVCSVSGKVSGHSTPAQKRPLWIINAGNRFGFNHSVSAPLAPAINQCLSPIQYSVRIVAYRELGASRE